MKLTNVLRAIVIVSISSVVCWDTARAAPSPQGSKSSSLAGSSGTKQSFGALWSEFKDGESIYEAPDADKLLEYPSIKNSSAAMKELAILVVKYREVEVQEEKGTSSPAARRTLGLAKTKFYFKYGVSQGVLKVAPVRQSAYTNFWQSFWARVDLFERGYRGDPSSPGPFVLPSLSGGASALVALNEGATTVAGAIERLLSVEESFAQVRENECKVVSRFQPTPVLNCSIRERDERFYYKRIGKRSHTSYHNRVRFDVTYDDNFDCKLVPGCKRERTGGVFVVAIREEEWCGPNLGDASGHMTRRSERTVTKNGEIEESYTEYQRYCLDSKDAAFPRYQEAYSKYQPDAKGKYERKEYNRRVDGSYEPEFFCPYDGGTLIREAFDKTPITWNNPQLDLAQQILDSYSVDSKGFHHLTIPSGVSDKDVMLALDKWAFEDMKNIHRRDQVGWLLQPRDVDKLGEFAQQCGTPYPLERVITVMPVVPGTEYKTRVEQAKVLSDNGLQFACIGDMALLFAALECNFIGGRDPMNSPYHDFLISWGNRLCGSDPEYSIMRGRHNAWVSFISNEGSHHCAASGSPSPKSE